MNKLSDVISMLVSIYNSKDIFVKALQVLLARLLMIVKDNSDQVEREARLFFNLRFDLPFESELMLCFAISFQRRIIEILKIQFGEAALQMYEVMLRDTTDWKWVDGHAQSQQVVHLRFRKTILCFLLISPFFESILQLILFLKALPLGDQAYATRRTGTALRSSRLPLGVGSTDKGSSDIPHSNVKRSSISSISESPSSLTSSLLPPSPSISLSAIPEGPTATLQLPRYDSSDQQEEGRALRASHRTSTSSLTSPSTAASNSYSTNIKRSCPHRSPKYSKKRPTWTPSSKNYVYSCSPSYLSSLSYENHAHFSFRHHLSSHTASHRFPDYPIL